MTLSLYALLFELDDVLAVLGVTTFFANIIAGSVGSAREVRLLLVSCGCGGLVLCSSIGAGRRRRVSLALVIASSLALLLSSAQAVELVLAHCRQLVEDFLALDRVRLLAILLMQR